MMTPIQFFAQGVPKPAGSKRGFALKKGGAFTGRVVITDDCKTSREWKGDVRRAAKDNYSGEILTQPLRLDLTFFMPRPKYHFSTSKKTLGQLKPDAPTHHTTKPDRTKLMRGTEDALTHIIWRDDAQICDGRVLKLYDDGRGPGCIIEIREI